MRPLRLIGGILGIVGPGRQAQIVAGGNNPPACRPRRRATTIAGVSPHSAAHVPSLARRHQDAGQTAHFFALAVSRPCRSRSKSMSRPAALPKTVLVGLPEAAVKESTHRVERALVNSGFLRPHDRVVINLAPAELPKQAASFDLPITLGHAGRQRTDRVRESSPIRRGGRVGPRRRHAADQGRAVDGHRRRGPAGFARAGRAQRQCGRGGGRRRDRDHRRQQPGPGGGFLHRPDRNRAHPAAARRMVSRPIRTTTSILPTFADRKWPSGP